MPGNRFNAFQDYGVGIGLRIPHYDHIFAHRPAVDWFEIISENYMVDGGRPLRMLDRIMESYKRCFNTAFYVLRLSPGSETVSICDA